MKTRYTNEQAVRIMLAGLDAEENATPWQQATSQVVMVTADALSTLVTRVQVQSEQIDELIAAVASLQSQLQRAGIEVR